MHHIIITILLQIVSLVFIFFAGYNWGKLKSLRLVGRATDRTGKLIDEFSRLDHDSPERLRLSAIIDGRLGVVSELLKDH